MMEAEMLVCVECGRHFKKRERTTVDNLFCDRLCEGRHDIKRFYKVPEQHPHHISNAAAIAMTQMDYHGGYTE